MLYNTNLSVKEGGGTFRARFGVERVVKRKVMDNGQQVEKEVHENLLAEGSYSVGSEIKDGYPEFTLGVLKKLGWDKDLSSAGDGNHSARESGQSRSGILVHGPFRRHPARGDQAWLQPYGNGKARMIAWNLPDPIPVHREPIFTPRPDLVAKYPTLPDARQFRVPNIGFTVQKAAVDKGISKELSTDLEFRPAGRIRGRRRGDAIEPLAGGVEAGHVCRDQSRRCGRARHRRRRLGVGDRAGEQFEGADEGAGDGARRQGRDVDALSFCRLVRGRRPAQQISEGRRSYVLGESVNTLTTYGYDPATGMQEPKATLCQIRAA